MRIFCAPAFLCSILLLCSNCLAQENPPAPQPAPTTRPRIGLALEGGGALGLAHIGVLKWFEEHHIPVDYIAGTSMGGLVGGLYATGQSADDLKHVVQSADWSLLLRGGTPYQDLSFRRKEDARDVPNTIQIGLKNGLTLPPGLNTGEQINLLIDRETLPYSTIPSFNVLPIPFRCVSTELVSGKPLSFRMAPCPTLCAPPFPSPASLRPCDTAIRFSSMAAWSTIFPPTWCATWARTS